MDLAGELPRQPYPKREDAREQGDLNRTRRLELPEARALPKLQPLRFKFITVAAIKFMLKAISGDERTVQEERTSSEKEACLFLSGAQGDFFPLSRAG